MCGWCRYWSKAAIYEVTQEEYGKKEFTHMYTT
jgi:hypothetical protein